MKLRNKQTGEISEFTYILLEGTNYRTYCSIDKLNEEWEDYQPKEPLIRDKNIRKAVKAWAYVNSIKEVIYCERPDRSLCLLTNMWEEDFDIEFLGWIPTLKDDKNYTIAELCGEEEE